MFVYFQEIFLYNYRQYQCCQLGPWKSGICKTIFHIFYSLYSWYRVNNIKNYFEHTKIRANDTAGSFEMDTAIFTCKPKSTKIAQRQCFKIIIFILEMNSNKSWRTLIKFTYNKGKRTPHELLRKSPWSFHYSLQKMYSLWQFETWKPNQPVETMPRHCFIFGERLYFWVLQKYSR